MSFKDISYLELWQSLCSVDWNHLCNFGRMHHEEQSCEIILVQEEMPYKGIFYIWCYICAILVEYYEEQFCENILKLGQSFKIFLIWSSGSPLVRWS